MMATFDREAARAAGWDDASINAYLGQHPELATPEQPQPAAPRGALRSISDTVPGRLSDLERSIRPGSTAGESGRSSDLTDLLLRSIPPTGGALGGLLGGAAGAAAGGIGAVPGALTGAGVGGAAGEWARQQIARALGRGGDPMQELGRIPIEGGIQSAMEATGMGLAGGVGMMAPALMRAGLRPNPSLVRRFPDVVETALKEGTYVGKPLPGMRAGADVVAERMGQSVADRAAALAQAQKAGARPITALDIVNEASRDIAKLRGSAMRPKDADAIQSAIDGFIEQKGWQVTPKGSRKAVRYTLDAANKIKQALQENAQRVFAAAQKGALAPQQQTGAEVDRALASAAKRLIEQRAAEVGVTNVGALNARTGSLLGVLEAARQAETRNPPRLRITEPATYPLVGPLAGDPMMTLYAHLANNPALLSTLRQSPRGLGLLFQSAAPDVTR